MGGKERKVERLKASEIQDPIPNSHPDEQFSNNGPGALTRHLTANGKQEGKNSDLYNCFTGPILFNASELSKEFCLRKKNPPANIKSEKQLSYMLIPHLHNH